MDQTPRVFHCCANRFLAGVSDGGDRLENHINWCIMLQAIARKKTSGTYELVGHDFDWSWAFPRWPDYCGQLDGQQSRDTGKLFPAIGFNQRTQATRPPENALQIQLESHRNLPVTELRIFVSLPWHLPTSISTFDTSMLSLPIPKAHRNALIVVFSDIHHGRTNLLEVYNPIASERCIVMYDLLEILISLMNVRPYQSKIQNESENPTC